MTANPETRPEALATLIERHRITASAALADANPLMADMPPGSAHYRVTLRMGRKRMTVPFSCGPAICEEPDAADVLSCLILDANGFHSADGFEDFAKEYGYDPDSRKTESIYRAVERQTSRLHTFLGDLSPIFLAADC